MKLEFLAGDQSAALKDYRRLLPPARAGNAVELTQLPAFGRAMVGRGEPADDEQACSCKAVSIGAIRAAIRGQLPSTAAEIKLCTRAGTGCGGCTSRVNEFLAGALARRGRAVEPVLCEHFASARQQLIERALFFAAVSSPGMPGALR